jgi:hypothetical protein
MQALLLVFIDWECRKYGPVGSMAGNRVQGDAVRIVNSEVTVLHHLRSAELLSNISKILG